MKYVYKKRKDSIIDECGNVHIVYGIEAWQDEICERIICDVFTDESIAEEFARLCTIHELSICHLFDAILDIMDDIANII